MDELQSNDTPDLALPRRTRTATPSIGGIEEARVGLIVHCFVAEMSEGGETADLALMINRF